jgi:Retinoic acid induced 16-like protein/Family of unknown function (DUF5917)
VDGLLDNKLFSRSLLDLVRYTVIGPRAIVDEDTEASLIELLFSICTKIRLDPDILPAWFHPERDRSQARSLQGETRRSQFPLFYVLVQYVHHDGPVGDFSRTGLLYLTETAAKSKPLETWMIESDLAPQMASGLGALYSRLSRQFPPLGEIEIALPILALSDFPQVEGSPQETREHFQRNLKEFLAYLAFWQDTLNHCKSAEVSDTLLDHFQVLFVQQLLYPSLLESSDVDGGSTAAVIAHLTRILLALDHPELARRMLGYLLASKASRTPQDSRKHRPRLSMSRRKSLDHLAALAEAAQSPSPDLFNLLDLIIMGLKSKHVNTVNGCLKLMTVIISKQHQHALMGLFRTESIDNRSTNQSVESFTNTLIEYFDIAGTISLADTMDGSYQGALADVKERLGIHSCIQALNSEKDDPALPLTVVPGCKLMESLLDLLTNFFGNGTMTNLLLTEALLAVTSCDRITLHGLLMPVPDADPKQTTRNVKSVLKELAEQVQQWKSVFGDWDSLISKRRRDLSEDDYVAVSNVRSVSGQTRASDGDSAARDQGDSSQQSSRPATPRGRSMGSPNFGSIDSALSASPNPRSTLVPRPLAGSPLRQSNLLKEPEATSSIRTASNAPSAPDLAELLLTRVSLVSEKGSEEGSQPLSLLTQRLEAGRNLSSEDSLTVVEETGSRALTPNPSENEWQPRPTHASLSHIVTNAIILQEFILEVAAVIQVRGSMFGEVDLNQ